MGRIIRKIGSLSAARNVLLAWLCFCLCIGMASCASDPAEQSSAESEASAAEDKPVTVQAGEFVFYADEVQRDLDMLLQDYKIVGEELSEEDRAAAAQEIVDSYVIRALTKARLKQLGLSEIDEETLYGLRDTAQRSYDAYWQSFRDSEASANLTDEQLTQYLEKNGIDLDYFFETALTAHETELILQHYGIEVKVTDADIDAFYEENYVKPCRERYENDIALFEKEVIYGDYDSAYTPEGFRILHQIVLPVPDDIREELVRIEEEAAEYAEKAQDAYNKVAELAMKGEDTTEQTEIYRSSMAKIDELNVEYGEVWQSVLTATHDQCDELYARMQTGETFDSLMELFKPNDILIFHVKSEVWSEELMAGAMTLKAKGDVSQPTLCSDGVHILYYYDDVPSGAAKLEDKTQRETLRESLVQKRTTDALKELTEPWGEEFGLKVDLSTLTY